MHLAVLWYQQVVSIWYEVSLHLEYVAPYHHSEFRATVVLLDANAAQTFVFQINENLHFIKSPLQKLLKQKVPLDFCKIILTVSFSTSFCVQCAATSLEEHVRRLTSREPSVKPKNLFGLME